MMKRYETDSYRKELTTQVTACRQDEKGIFIQLAETIFFPEEGGQYADTGSLSYDDKIVALTDGQIRQGEIWYQVDKEIPVGTTVTCRLDWEMRFMRMQQHSGEHIITGLIHNNFGFDNVGFHLSDTAPVTLDMNGKLTPEQVYEMERLANQVVYRNLPIVDSYPAKEELPNLEYRSKIEIAGQVRLITVGAGNDIVDVCACCAPHVARTGEVGIIKVVGVQNYKGGTRVSILCGERALEDYQRRMEVTDTLAKGFSTSVDKVLECVERQKEEAAELRYQLAVLAEGQLMGQIEAMRASTHACLFVEQEINGTTAKNCYNAMTEKFPGYVGLFIGSDENGYRFQAGSRSLDAKELMNQMRPVLNAKGGGSSEMAQGKLNAKKAEIEAFFQTL